MLRSLTSPASSPLPQQQLSGIFGGGDVTDALLDFGAQAAGAMFAHHFGGMDWGARQPHISTQHIIM